MPAGTTASAVEVQFLTELPRGDLTPRSPRDFSSNSQTSQGFQPTAAVAVVPSDSSASGSTRVKPQKVPSLTNLTTEEDENSPSAALPTGVRGERMKRERMKRCTQRLIHNHTCM